MISGINQSYASSINNANINKTDKESKTNETQKTENTKLAKIAEQIKNGEYKLDTKATAEAIADSLL
ncbi:hypothetical protein DMB92_00935 [Campylobacter sp. MIT 99-7217]|uniref:flagellar biosynthesis anti-sigma factor FlgM n=1 Tax=Campylobacter sp. MIT 99-7217 TaxID=535091 RepID=UPI001157D79A|nr:flagellar biosynthesis anti-sigma factor FlgM [Campylobacter sp. MIT 99-7217]TQR34562.1 hypothetical protein DMB92_00935 [Campylobacter sp. MIT 99-7217]